MQVIKEQLNLKKCDKLDTLIRNCQGKESIGIPIGPDSSFLFAEILLNRVDQAMSQSIDFEYEAKRYYDDYYFFVNDEDQAERILKEFQKEIFKYKLEVNESKVEISKRPFVFSEDWTNEFLIYSNNNVSSRNKLREYFNNVFESVKRYPSYSDWILNYCLFRFELESNEISKSNWKLFLSYMLSSLSLDNRIIKRFLNVIINYKPYIDSKDSKKIKESLESIVVNSIELNHHFESSWAIWAMIALRIKCSRDIITLVLDEGDNVSKVLILDLVFKNLVEGRKPALTKYRKLLSSTDLQNENWLYTYTVIEKDWLVPYDSTIKDEYEYMKMLFDDGVSFYDVSATPEINFIAGLVSESENKTDDSEKVDSKVAATTPSEAVSEPSDESANLEFLPRTGIDRQDRIDQISFRDSLFLTEDEQVQWDHEYINRLRQHLENKSTNLTEEEKARRLKYSSLQKEDKFPEEDRDNLLSSY